VELDRPGAQEDRPADLGIGLSLGHEQGDLQLLGVSCSPPLPALAMVSPLARSSARARSAHGRASSRSKISAAARS
jgi:hypothetical protein